MGIFARAQEEEKAKYDHLRNGVMSGVIEA
jgi:hypothetical protein